VGHAYRQAGIEMREKMLKHHFEQGVPREFLSALIAAKCQSNADRIHIIEQLQRLETDLQETPDVPAKQVTETACFTKSGWKPNTTTKPVPTPEPQEGSWQEKMEEQLETLRALTSPALLAVAASWKRGGRGRGHGRGNGWRGGKHGGDANKSDKTEDAPLNEKGSPSVAQGAGPSN
jgi:hypothetical protein